MGRFLQPFSKILGTATLLTWALLLVWATVFGGGIGATAEAKAEEPARDGGGFRAVSYVYTGRL